MDLSQLTLDALPILDGIAVAVTTEKAGALRWQLSTTADGLTFRWWSHVDWMDVAVPGLDDMAVYIGRGRETCSLVHFAGSVASFRRLWNA